MELYLPGFIEELIAGIAGGSQITPELMLALAIGSLIPPVMAFLSLILKDSMNRWANIIVGIVFAVFAIVLGPVAFLTQPSAYYVYAILIGIVQFAATALVVWYAWKSKQKI
jgi:MFS family permease